MSKELICQVWTTTHQPHLCLSISYLVIPAYPMIRFLRWSCEVRWCMILWSFYHSGKTLWNNYFSFIPSLFLIVQSSRLEEQRSSLPSEQRKAPTVPDEDFFRLIMRLQSGRIEDQRSNIPINMNTPKKASKVGGSGGGGGGGGGCQGMKGQSGVSTTPKSKSGSIKSTRSHKSKREK